MTTWTIEVKDEEEGKAIEEGLKDPVVRASVVVYGVLKTLESDRARRRVITYIGDFLDEKATL